MDTAHIYDIWLKKEAFDRLNFGMKVFRPSISHIYLVQHSIHIRGKNADVTELQQMSDKLLVSKTHKTEEPRPCIEVQWVYE